MNWAGRIVRVNDSKTPNILVMEVIYVGRNLGSRVGPSESKTESTYKVRWERLLRRLALEHPISVRVKRTRVGQERKDERGI